MAAGDIYRVSFEGTLCTYQYVNTMHVKLLLAGSDIEDFISQVFTAGDWWPNYLAGRADDLALTVTHARQLIDDPATIDVATPAAGSQTGMEPLPPQVACVVKWATGYVGRSRRGRSYFGGLTEPDQNGGTLVASTVSSIQGYVDDFVDKYGAAGTDLNFQIGVWSEKLGHPSPGVWNYTLGWRPIISGLVRPIVGIQRRRRLGVGA